MQLHQRAVLQQGHACTMPLLPQLACWGEPGAAVPRLGASPRACFPTASGSVQVKVGAQSWRSCLFFLPCVCAKKTVRSDHACNTPPHCRTPLFLHQLFTTVFGHKASKTTTLLGHKAIKSCVCVDSWARWPEAAG